MPRFRLPLGTFALLAGLVGLVPAAQPVLQPGGLAGAGQPPATPAASDEEVLKQAGLSPADGPQLVAYLKQRSVSDLARGKLDDLIRQLAADRYADRLKAEDAIERFGPAAVGPLQ